MNKVLKSLVLASCLAGLSACSSTGKIDYDDSVETPDVLLEDAQGGDSEYGLDKNAARNNQQNKPDGLLQSTGSSSTASASSSRKSSSSTARTVEAQPESQPKAQKQVAQAKPAKKKKPNKPKKQPSKQESALEVDDPLLGEIDPQ